MSALGVELEEQVIRGGGIALFLWRFGDFSGAFGVFDVLSLPDCGCDWYRVGTNWELRQ